MDTHKSIRHHLPSQSLLFFTLFSLFQSCLCWTGLSVQYSITGFEPEYLQSENRMMELFQQWKKKHGKSYENSEELMNRFQNFKCNLKYIVERNSNRSGNSMGLNRFSDMSNEEFREKYIGKVKGLVELSQRKHTRARSVLMCDAPPSLDWREKEVVTPVKDQGVSGSSWVFSSIGAIEGINAINKGELVTFSEQELLSFNKSNYDGKGGHIRNAFEWVINNGGVVSEANCPYTTADGTCSTTKAVNSIVHIDGYGNVEESDTALMCATVNQPIRVGIDASSIDFQLYTGGIYAGSCSSNPADITHAVLIVGYGSEGDTDYWIVKNSWGTTWGMDGYIYIKRNTNLTYGVCAIHALASYPIQTTSAKSPSSAPSDSPPLPPQLAPPNPSPLPSAPAPSPPLTPPSPTPSSPSPPPLSPPPPPPTPSPTPSHKCGSLSYCLPGQTCCCLYEFLGFCLIQGCCDYSNAVCCPESDYCCPVEYPICEADTGLCLKNYEDKLGVAMKKKKWAKHILSLNKHEESAGDVTYQTLKWRRNWFAAIR
ncbi:cysteine protease XCP1-like [Amaranthus tricolor]|uniref:cysteine protease XCP1-like n=1 Tax=Amaranthus tricolor TaxID=29722 RepID=UPI00258523EF|nr:cysteine protease XCP1-like [Amaranthus tricolor]